MSAFNDIPLRSAPIPNGKIAGSSYMQDIASMQIGIGSRGFRADNNGMWIGADKFSTAPFSVDLNGNGVANRFTFKDSNGQTVIDSDGIKSSTQFVNDFYSDDTIITTLSSSFADVAGSSKTFVLTNEANVLICFFSLIFTYITNASFQYNTIVAVSIDGVEQSPYATDGYYQSVAKTLIKSSTVSCARIFTLAAGSHTIKLRWLTTAAQADMGSRNLNYLILGK